MRHSSESFGGSGERQIDASDTRNLGRQALAIALERQNGDMTMADFGDIYSAEKIASDERYVRKFEKFVSGGEKNNLAPAQIFEQMFTNGVLLGNWLGNVEFEDGHTVEKFNVEAHNTLPYDDIRNKIDTFTTLSFSEPIEDEDFGTTINKVALGFDVTTNNSREKLLDKITRFYNGNQKLPFGFSQLEYYSDTDEHGPMPMLPRYTIGLSMGDINAIAETAKIRERDGTVDFGLFSGKNLVNRFKILSEIRAENELYQAMLPDDMDSEIVQQANVQLFAVDQCLHDALEVCTQELANRKCLPPQVINEIEAAKKKGRGVQARNIVQEYLLSKSQEIFDSESKEQAAWGKDIMGDGDTFVQIIKLCNELKDAAYAGELDKHRAVMAHNQGIQSEEFAAQVA